MCSRKIKTKITAKTRAGCGLEDRMRFEILPEHKRIRRVAAWAANATQISQSKRNLVHRTGRTHTRIKLDFAERALVARDVLLQESEQSLCLLGTQIDPLEVADLDLGLSLLLQSAEDEKEIPDVHAHLHAIGIVLFIVGRIVQLDVRLCRNAHRLAV